MRLLNPLTKMSIFSGFKGDLATKLTKLVEAYQLKTKRECVVLALKTNLPNEIYSRFQVVSINDPVQELDLWMREDGHGTSFDTGCTVIVTNFSNLNKGIERKFKNLLWIVLDRVPQEKEIEVDGPVVEMFENIITVRCPYTSTKIVSFFKR